MTSTAKKRRDPPSNAAPGSRKSRKTEKASHPQDFVAVAAPPKSKHHTYFEFVENTAKKKKLEFKIVTEIEPPPGFEFVPIGNPELTTACKEISREKDAMIFIVSECKESEIDTVAQQVNRIGHHVRRIIAEEARASLSHLPERAAGTHAGVPEPIPSDQDQYDAQVDAVIRDLFPRIPHTAREMIIQHSFQLNWSGKGEPPVGLSGDITLARRVQLATLAHIRHTHTRYDELLRETTRNTARAVVQQACLDTIVKWRGDEENGRDDLDEILQEVVVISDSEEDDDLDWDDELPSGAQGIADAHVAIPGSLQDPASSSHMMTNNRSPGLPHQLRLARAEERKNQRGFKRYRAFNEAIRRNEEASLASTGAMGSETIPNPGPDDSVRNTTRRVHPLAEEEPRRELRHAFLLTHPSNPAAPAQQVSDTSMFDRQQPQASSSTFHEPSSSSHQFQDWLVRSIESPPREVMKPAFVRTVPPRPTLQEDHLRMHKPHWTAIESPNRSPRASAQNSPRGGVSHGIPGRLNAAVFRAPPREDYMYARAHDLHIPAESLSRLDLGATGPNEVPPRRILVETGRFGDRVNPILMEDRGGFFERVPSNGDGPASWDPDHVEYRRAYPGGLVAHRVVSSTEGSRILQESHGRSVEIIPKQTAASSFPLHPAADLTPMPSRPPLAGPSWMAHREYHAPSHPDRMTIDQQHLASREENGNPVFWQIRRDGHGSAFEPHSYETSFEQQTHGRGDGRRQPAPSPIVID